MSRPSFQESIQLLQKRGVLDRDEAPSMPSRMPQPEDEVLGLEYFRTALEGDDLSGVSIPRTFLCRSEISGVRFENSDLSESFACWCDFVNSSFRGADLSRSDLRSSTFERVSFCEANLSGADLRHSAFIECDFTGANVTGAKLTKIASRTMKLEAEQLREIAWQETDGPEPHGG